VPGRPRSPEADAAILAAALDLLLERGIAATSIEQVARRAGVTRATVYRRFPDRTQLLIATVEAAYGNPSNC
jgi:AcrR family transcriptional regulator